MDDNVAALGRERVEVLRTKFLAGDKVPSWLMKMEPMSRESVPGDITFCVPCEVYEFSDHFAVLPLVLGQLPQVMYAGGEKNKILATSKPVNVAIGTLSLVGDQFGTYHADQMFGRPPEWLGKDVGLIGVGKEPTRKHPTWWEIVVGVSIMACALVLALVASLTAAALHP